MEVFSWRPLLETPGQFASRIHVAQFGGGYKQAVGDGINNITESWNLTFKSDEATIMAIHDFLRQHGGFIPFLWTPKASVQKQWDCEEFRVINHTSRGYGSPLTENPGIWMLTATFNQRFSP